MAQFIKGQAVYANYGSDHTPFFAKETSCSYDLTANTIDASNKQDTNPDYDSPEFDDYEGSMSVEGQLKDVAEIRSLLTLMQGNNVSNIVIGGPDQHEVMTASEGYITSLDIDMPADGLVTGSMSVDLAGTINVLND